MQIVYAFVEERGSYNDYDSSLDVRCVSPSKELLEKMLKKTVSKLVLDADFDGYRVSAYGEYTEYRIIEFPLVETEKDLEVLV